MAGTRIQRSGIFKTAPQLILDSGEKIIIFTLRKEGLKMPFYEYHCNSCNKDFEVQKKITEPPETDCIYCGSHNTQRLVSLCSFILKGTGWYITDYGRKNGTPQKRREKKRSSNGESGK